VHEQFHPRESPADPDTIREPRYVDARYYTPALHAASFVLPRFVQELVSAAACPREEIGAEILGRALSRGASGGMSHA